MCLRNHASEKRSNETFKEVRKNINQPRIMYLAKLSFKSEREIKTFLYRQNLKKFVAIRLVLQGMLQ